MRESSDGFPLAAAPRGHYLRETALVQGYLLGKQGKDILGEGESR